MDGKMGPESCFVHPSVQCPAGGPQLYASIHEYSSSLHHDALRCTANPLSASANTTRLFPLSQWSNLVVLVAVIVGKVCKSQGYSLLSSHPVTCLSWEDHAYSLSLPPYILSP